MVNRFEKRYNNNTNDTIDLARQSMAQKRDAMIKKIHHGVSSKVSPNIVAKFEDEFNKFIQKHKDLLKTQKENTTEQTEPLTVIEQATEETVKPTRKQRKIEQATQTDTQVIDAPSNDLSI